MQKLAFNTILLLEGENIANSIAVLEAKLKDIFRYTDIEFEWISSLSYNWVPILSLKEKNGSDSNSE